MLESRRLGRLKPAAQGSCSQPFLLPIGAYQCLGAHAILGSIKADRGATTVARAEWFAEDPTARPPRLGG